MIGLAGVCIFFLSTEGGILLAEMDTFVNVFGIFILVFFEGVGLLFVIVFCAKIGFFFWVSIFLFSILGLLIASKLDTFSKKTLPLPQFL